MVAITVSSPAVSTVGALPIASIANSLLCFVFDPRTVVFLLCLVIPAVCNSEFILLQWSNVFVHAFAWCLRLGDGGILFVPLFFVKFEHPHNRSSLGYNKLLKRNVLSNRSGQIGVALLQQG